MKVTLAETEQDIERCSRVMLQLRPHLTADEFVVRVQRQQRQDGYLLAFLEVKGAVLAVAGFRISEMLFRGRFLYVDDLVTESGERSRGYGKALFEWLVEYARAHGCGHLELDSGVQRAGAHRFYFRQGMQISSYHFSMSL